MLIAEAVLRVGVVRLAQPHAVETGALAQVPARPIVAFFTVAFSRCPGPARSSTLHAGRALRGDARTCTG